MKRAFLAILLMCSACAAKPQAPSAELVMTTEGKGTECILTLDGQQFVTEHLESAALQDRLRQLRGRKVVLQTLGDTPYRCIGSAIIMLQGVKATFRVPQLKS